MLFALFLCALGKELQGTQLGISIGLIIITAIIFADDIVLIGSSRAKLQKLMRITRRYFLTHKMDLSTSKTKVLVHDASEGKMIFDGDDVLEDIHLDQVICLKYLGIPINCAPYSLFKNFNEQVCSRARNYAYRVISLVRGGPNRAHLAYSLWNQVALPSILYGTEVIPVTKETISKLDKCQSIVGKFILQIPHSSAQVSSYIDAGLQPIRSIIANRVLTYAR